MGQLTTSDLRAALDFVAEFGDAGSLDDFARTVVRGIREVVPASVAVYEESGSVHRAAWRVTDPPRLTRKVAAAKGVLRMRVHARPSVVVMLRRDGVFSPRDRSLVQMLRPHIRAADRNLRAREEAAALRAGMLASERQFLLASTSGQILDASPGAVEVLRRYIPHGTTADVVADIVDPSRRPCRQQDGVQAEVLEGGAGRLAVRVLPAAAPAPCMVLVEELTTVVPDVSFGGLGLTTREVEVARLVVDGRTNTQIAAVLVVSPHTVKKHLEHVYTKLGVHTRTELVAVVHGAASRPHEPAWPEEASLFPAPGTRAGFLRPD